MTCQECRREVHDFLDHRLSHGEQLRFRQHLHECDNCRQFHRQLEFVKQALASKVCLSELSERYLWQRIEGQIRRNRKAWIDWRLTAFRKLRNGWVGEHLWARLAAAPVTVGFFLLILVQFPRVEFQEWKYPGVSASTTATDTISRPVLTQVSGRFKSSQIEDLMKVIWEIPFEDSLSVLAEISPDGHAEIGDILEYPRSQDLLEAVDLSLRRGHFKTHGAGDSDRHFLIYSLQKVDVYEEQQGL